MELGFSVAAGPLSQISISLFNVELAVQLATGAYGWWKARDRSRSLVGLVGSKGAQISATSTFNLLLYVDRRKDCLVRGVARGPDGVLSCVTLPHASTASAGDAGMICLRAVVCGLLCFYDTPTVLEILVGALPGTLYTSDQDGGNETIDGPLLSCLREYLKAAAIEENSDELRQKLQDLVDTRLSNITGATRTDVFDCDEFLESDAPNFIGVLRWILTPVLQRKQRVYPTRSLKVWAFGVIMAQLGFEVFASMHTISSKDQYEIYVENVGYQATYQEIFLVTSNDVPTDPLTARGQSVPLVSMPRIGSIRSIPRIAFRHLNDTKSYANTNLLSEVWEFTFDYVLNSLEPPPIRRFLREDDYGLAFTRAALDGFEDKNSYIPSNSKPYSKLQWLTFLLFKPLRKFRPLNSDTDSIWSRTNTPGQFRGCATDFLALPEGEGTDDWYITRAAALAAIYAFCCKWLQPNGNMANLLDTEVAFCPDFIRRGNLEAWTSFRCFSSWLFTDRVPTTFQVDWKFTAAMSHVKWLNLLYLVFSGTSKDLEMERRCNNLVDPDTFNTTILGFQKNGVTLVPVFLIHPSTKSQNWFTYHLRVGQVLDLPLDENGFICHANRAEESLTSGSWEYDSVGQLTTLVENLPSDVNIRLDAEPWWEIDERTVVIRARVDGIVKAIFHPQTLYKKYLFQNKSEGECDVPITESLELKTPVVVLRVSDFLSNSTKRMVSSKDKKLPVFVQTGGDDIAQLVCLGLSSLYFCKKINRGFEAQTQYIYDDYLYSF